MSINNFNKIKNYFNEHLDNIIDTICNDNTEKEILKYALKNGKRLRPCISIDQCIKSGGNIENVINFAVALELIHTASLIIDDLPCMDDDGMRRNQVSTHIKYGEKKAQICSNKMIEYAIKLVLKNFNNKSANILLYIIKNLSKNLGVLGAAGGQYLDTLNIDKIYSNKKNIKKNLDKNYLKNILELKTSCLFEVAFVGGYLSANNTLENIVEIENLGNKFGLIFQIYDDFLDIEQDKQRINNNLVDCNYINNYGVAETYTELNNLINNFKENAKRSKIFTEVIDELIIYMIAKINSKINFL